MKKFKKYIKDKLIWFLGVDTILQDIKRIDENCYNIDQEIGNIKYKIIPKNISNIENQISHFQQSVNTLHNTVENVVHIGTDVRQYGGNREHSWSVVCIEGKVNIVKFVDLSRNDARYILDFLKQFEAGKHCIDTPCKEMFYDGIFKFESV